MPATIDDIAVKAGVSRATVSRVLNSSGYVKDETKQKVLAIIKELNYIPSAIARSLSTKKTNIIGVIIPEIDDPFFAEIIKGIILEADINNLNLLLFDTQDNGKKELKALELLIQQRIEGIIITPTLTKNNLNSEYLKSVENSGIPVLLIDGHVEYDNFNGVFIDHIKGAYDATNELIKAGHKKIAIITGEMSSRPARLRFEGYSNALRDNGIKINENYILNGNYKYEDAYEATNELFNLEDRPSALFVCSNMMILGAMKALKERKLEVPKDMAMMGFDKLEVLNILGFNISYADARTMELGQEAMKMMVNILNNKNHRIDKKIISPTIVLKGSELKI